MSTDHNGAQESNDVPTSEEESDWEHIAREKIRQQAKRHERNLGDAVHELLEKFNDGEQTAEDIRHFRRPLDALLFTIEGDIAQLTDGVETYDAPAYYFREDSEAADYLGLDMAEVQEAKAGPVVELGEPLRKHIAAGNTVEVETDAGISITLTAEETRRAHQQLSLDESDLQSLLDGDAIWKQLGTGQSVEVETTDLATENTGP